MGRYLLTAGFLGLTALGLAGCTVEEPARFNPKALQLTERNTSTELQTRRMRPLPTTLESPTTQPTATAPTTRPFEGGEPTIRLSLQELIHRTAANNLDAKVAGYGVAIDQTRVIEAEARFDPTFFANTQYQRRNNATAGQTVGDPNNIGLVTTSFIDRAEISSWQTGIRQNLENGAQAELRYSMANNSFVPQRTVIDPYYENDLTLQVTQPLLQNFGNEVNRARITINRNNQKISLLDFRKTLEENLANVEQTYWQLVQAEQDVRIQQELLDRTYQTYDVLSKRFQGGLDVTRLQTSQAQASLESRQATLVRAKARVRDLSDQMKRLMSDPQFPVTGAAVILPAAPPVEAPLRFDLKDQIDTAMEFRLELAQQQLRIENASTTVLVARNNELPTLNLVGSVGTQGLGGSPGSALDEASGFSNINYTIGLQFEVPIGNRAARAIYQRSTLQRQQAIDQYRALVEQVSLEVKVAAREVLTTWDEIIATRRARFSQADALLAIQQREENQEPLTPTFVQLKLDTQARLAEAQSAEAGAISNYNIAIARLERAKGTLLRYENVIMEEDKMPFLFKSTNK